MIIQVRKYINNMGSQTKFKNFYNIYLWFVSILVSLPVIAPILLKIGLELPAKLIYFVYSFFCHQFSTRSIHLYDYQYAWCARDTGIWFGVALAAWLIKFKKLTPIKWYWVIPFVIPIALDGGIQTIFTMFNLSNSGLVGIPLYSSNNLVRFITGSIFGLGLSLWVSGSIYQESNDSSSETILQIDNKKQLKNLFLSISLLVIFYIGLVGLWSMTSKSYPPADFADSVVRLQDKNFFERRANGACPTEGVQDAFNIECFFR